MRLWLERRALSEPAVLSLYAMRTLKNRSAVTTNHRSVISRALKPLHRGKWLQMWSISPLVFARGDNPSRSLHKCANRGREHRRPEGKKGVNHLLLSHCQDEGKRVQIGWRQSVRIGRLYCVGGGQVVRRTALAQASPGFITQRQSRLGRGQMFLFTPGQHLTGRA